MNSISLLSQRSLVILAAGLFFITNCTSFDVIKNNSGFPEHKNQKFSKYTLDQTFEQSSAKLNHFINEVKWGFDKAALRFLAENDLAYGEKLYNAKKYKDAGFYLSKGLVLFPENQRALKHLAWALFFQQRYDLALDAFKRCHGFYPKDPDPVIGFAWSQFAIKQYKNSISSFELAKNINGNTYEISKGQGFSYLALQNKDKAKEAFSQVFSEKEFEQIVEVWKIWKSKDSNSSIPIVTIDPTTNVIFQLPIEQPRYRSALIAQANIVSIDRINQAWEFYNQGEINKALSNFEALRTINYPDAANGLAWTLLAKDRFLDAEAIFNDILKTHPGFAGAVSGLRKAEQLKQEKAIYAKYYFDLQKYAIAIAYYNKLASHYPGWAFPHKQSGLVHLTLKDYNSAKTNFEVALQLDPENSDALEGMKEVYKNKVPLLFQANEELNRKNFKSASQLYMDFLETPQKNFDTSEILAEAYNGLGWSYYGKNQYSLAISKFKEAIKHPKFQYQAALGIGKIYFLNKDFNKASKYLNIAYRNHFGKNGFGWDSIFIPYGFDETFSKIGVNQEDLIPDSEEKELVYKLDWSILQSKGIEESEVIFQNILKKYPLRASAYMALGWIYYQKNKPDLAVEYFLKSISLDPDFALTEEFSKVLDEERFGWQVYNRFGWEYFYRKRYDKSIYLFQVAMGRHSTSSETFKGIGYNYYKKGDYSKAISFFKKSQLLNRSSHSIEEWIEGENAITPFPLKTNINSKLGWSHFHLKQYNFALQKFKQALEKNPDWSTIYNGLGWTYLKMERLLEAKAAFNKAIHFQPLNNSAHKGLQKVKQTQAEKRLSPIVEIVNKPKRKSPFIQKNKT